jgi:hypothetical protein
MDAPKRRWHERGRYALYYAGPLAAAAVIALAFVGVFDRGNGTRVEGLKVENVEAPSAPVVQEPAATALEADESTEAEHALDEWIDQTRQSLQDKRQSGESLQKALDLTVGQWLDILEQANDTSSPEDHFPGADATGGPTEDAPGPIESVDIVE